MSSAQPDAAAADGRVGEIDACLRRLFPLHRSLTGAANRETLATLGELVPLTVHEYASGEPVYDWTIPREWRVREAWIKDAAGDRIVDLTRSNLHVVSYSTPVRGRYTLEALRPHLHFREDLPDAIPYRTSYYREDWGFCLSHREFLAHFHDGEEYEVLIDAEFTDGSLTVGELLIPGRHADEVLVSTYFCHPSLANDNLSGAVLTAFLARELLRRDNNLSYRIVFVPETIGAIAYCAHNEAAMKRIDSGLVVTCVGGPGQFYTKQSFDPGHPVNRFVAQALAERGADHITYPFDIHGSDERQYASQGFRINVASVGRDRYYEYPQYHTSLDNLDLVRAEYIEQSLQVHLRVLELLDRNLVYRSRNPHCEVMLSKHDLYPKTGGALNFACGERTLGELDIILWLLFHCDGRTSLQQIAERLGAPLDALFQVAEKIAARGILECLGAPPKLAPVAG